MRTPAKIAIVAGLALAVGATVMLKHGTGSTTTIATGSNGPTAAIARDIALPRLVDLGSTKCVPCKMMAPILDELRSEFAGRMTIEFLDVMEVPEIGKAFNIKLIPTQVFFDSTGKELFRHEGFFSKEEILSKWKELGVDLGAGKDAAKGR